ncbi:MAG: TonB-dependent receptor [Dysgonomonas sp.]|nr:TonB-dependent receptor [Dysgonomonas sp.]
MKKLIMILACIFASVGLSLAQTTQVTGTVIDDTGETVIGASVVAKGTTVGTVTDLDGKFSLNVPSGTKTIVISLIGYKPKEVAAGTNLRITMESDSKLIDEVVVTGYGVVKKASFTGAASVISTSKLENVPGVSMESKLAGAIAGLQAGSSTGQPGAVESIRIRGTGSVNASTEPLYVIDGVPMNVGNANTELNYTQSGNSILSTLNSNDIESITVIKDAAAASLYGSRAANGVVIITTKSGKAGKTTVGFRANWGFSNMAIDYRPTLNGEERRELLTLGLKNYKKKEGASEEEAITYANSEIDKYAKKPEGGWTDWKDLLFRTGKQSNYEVNLQGGNDRTSFYSSLSFTDVEGITIQSDYERITGRLNLTHKVDKFTFGANITYAASKQDANSEGTSYSSPIMAIAMTTTPSDYPYNPDGSWNISEGFNAFPRPRANPLYNMHLNYNKSNINRFLGALNASYDITPDLSVSEKLSYDYVQTNTKVWWDPRSNDGLTSNGVFQKVTDNRKTLTSQTRLNYAKSIDGVHNIDGLVSYELEKYKWDYIYANGNNYPTYAKPEIENAASSRAVSHYEDRRMISYVASLNYNYDNKYYVGASFRRDGSSQFSKDERWGNFWSVSGSWRLTEEAFAESLKPILSDAKIRLSYGTNGTLPLGLYDYMDVYEFGYKYNSKPGSAEGRLAYNELTWEKSKNLNAGLDLSFIDRISVTLDLYTKTSTDLLLERSASQTTGFSNIMMNIGEMENKGVELSIQSTNIATKDFMWSTTLNLAHNKNELKKIDGQLQEFQRNEVSAQARLMHRIGNPFNSLYAYEYAGVDRDTGKEMYYINKPGQERVTTTNAAEAQQVIIGNVDPKVQGGLTNTLTYKGIDLGFTLTYSFGGHVYDNASWLNSNGGGYNYNVAGYNKISEMWQNPGDIAKLPQFAYGNVYQPSSRWMYSTDHIRLKNVTLGYTLPKNILNTLKISKARVYASAVNLFTIKPGNLYVDPELPIDPTQIEQAVGVVTMQTPPLRTVTFGIEVSF